MHRWTNLLSKAITNKKSNISWSLTDPTLEAFVSLTGLSYAQYIARLIMPMLHTQVITHEMGALADWVRTHELTAIVDTKPRDDFHYFIFKDKSELALCKQRSSDNIYVRAHKQRWERLLCMI